MIGRWWVVAFVMCWPVSLLAATAGTVSVVAEQDGSLLTPVFDHSTVIKQIDYVGLDATTELVTTSIHFSGTEATPAATIVVDIPAAEISRSVTVAEDGQWEIIVPTSDLTAGSYYAYVATAEASSQSTPVAYFTVQVDQNLSLATWLFLGVSTLAIFALLMAITLQLRYNSAHHAVL